MSRELAQIATGNSSTHTQTHRAESGAELEKNDDVDDNNNSPHSLSNPVPCLVACC
jgi:hypothetical protein